MSAAKKRPKAKKGPKSETMMMAWSPGVGFLPFGWGFTRKQVKIQYEGSYGSIEPGVRILRVRIVPVKKASRS